MKKLYILKIGGSVATYKNRNIMVVRRKLLNKVAKNIKKFIDKNKNIQLIIVHGAGGGGHYLAKKYNLQNGTLNNKNKLNGSLLCSLTIQNLNKTISKIFFKNKINIQSIQTSSIIIQNNKKIKNLNKKIIENSIKNNFVPLLYGDMVYDEKIGMSICSGDKIIHHLSNIFTVEKIFFATDVEGIFTDDPHKNKKAQLIKNISLAKIFKNKKIKLSQSHNVDVTDGLFGKIKSIKDAFKNSNLSEINIFNGLKAKNYSDILNDEKINCTKIKK